MNRSTEKYCKKGNHKVDRTRFYKHCNTVDGLMTSCMDCMYKEEKERKLKKKEGTIKAF